MKVILLQNSVFKGVRYVAGQELDLPADVAKAMIAGNLAYSDEVQKSEAEVQKSEAEVQKSEAEVQKSEAEVQKSEAAEVVAEKKTATTVKRSRKVKK